MNPNKNSDLIGYIAVLCGLAIYILWLLQVRSIFAGQTANLPVHIDQLPTQLVYWISIILIIAPFTMARFSKPVRMLSLFTLLFIVIFAFALQSPFNVPYSRDPQYTLQASEMIKDSGYWVASTGTGQARGYSDFPGLPIYHVMLSSLSGISLTQAVMWGMGIFRFAIFPLLLFLFFRSILKTNELGLFALFVYFTSPSMTNHPHYEGMAIVFGIAMVYLVFVSEHKYHWRTVALASVLGAATVFTHHFTSYVVFAWLFALAALAIVFVIVCRIPRVSQMSHAIVSERIDWKRFTALFLIFAFMLAGWSMTYGAGHYQLYVAGLNNGFLDVIFPEPAAKQVTASAAASVPRVVGESPLSFATATPESPQQIALTPPNPPKPNVISESINKIRTQVMAGNFKPSEILIVGVVVVLALSLLGYGFILRLHELSFIEIGNFIFFGTLTLAGFLMVVVVRYNIISRMFEFTYIGMVTFLVAGLIALRNRPTLFRQVVFSICAIAMLVAGNLMVSSGQERSFYVADNKATLDSSQVFLTPSTAAMASWSLNNFRNKHAAGESFIFDTVGAYGQVNVHIYEPTLVRGVYNGLTFTDRVRQQMKYDFIEVIFTHKYLATVGSQTGGPFPAAALRKFDEQSWLTRAYDSSIIQAYYLREQI